jgi:hypothetical protein
MLAEASMALAERDYSCARRAWRLGAASCKDWSKRLEATVRTAPRRWGGQVRRNGSLSRQVDARLGPRYGGQWAGRPGRANRADADGLARSGSSARLGSSNTPPRRAEPPRSPPPSHD